MMPFTASSTPSKPSSGDWIIRQVLQLRIEIVPASGEPTIGPFRSFAIAYARARAEAKGARIWQQSVDCWGRPLTQPRPLFDTDLAADSPS